MHIVEKVYNQLDSTSDDRPFDLNSLDLDSSNKESLVTCTVDKSSYSSTQG